MNIIKRELRANLKSLLIWSCCISAIIAIMMTEYEAFADNPEMASLFDAMPEAIMTAFSLAGANLTTLSGFVSMASVYFYIMLGIFAVLLGSSIVSKEERDKTTEFLLTLPVSRQRILLGKLIAAVINCLIINCVTAAAVLASSSLYFPDEGFYEFMRLLMTALFLIQLIFLSIGMLFSAIMKHYKQSGYASIAVLLSTYIISIVIALTDKIDFMKYITPFKYFDAQYLLNYRELEIEYLVISFTIIVSAFLGTFIFYPRRDLHI